MIVHDTVATSMFCLYLFYFNCLCLIYLLLCERICTWGRLQVFFVYSLSCFPASIGYVAWIKYLLPDPWMLLSLQHEIAREGRSLWLQDDIPQRPVEVQQNLKAKGGSPFSLGCSHALAQMRGFHVRGLFVSALWLLEKGEVNVGRKCGLQTGTLDDVVLPCSSWKWWLWKSPVHYEWKNTWWVLSIYLSFHLWRQLIYNRAV